MSDVIFEAGDKVVYKLTNSKGEEKWFKGVIHGVRKYESPKLNRITAMSYLVDTGLDFRVDEITTEEGEDNIFLRQPKQVEVHPDNVRADNQ